MMVKYQNVGKISSKPWWPGDPGELLQQPDISTSRETRSSEEAWGEPEWKRPIWNGLCICVRVFVLEEALGEPKWKEPFWNGLRRNSLWQDDQLEKRWSKILQNHGLFSRIDVKPLFKDKINIWKLSGSSRETKPARNKGDRVPQVGLFYTIKYSHHLVISCLW